MCIEPESYEAWNNLSNSYIQLKEYGKAFSSLHEAIKLSYDNWHIWENLMVVAADCGEFNDVIKACHRLLDLKEKHVDTEVIITVIIVYIVDVAIVFLPLNATSCHNLLMKTSDSGKRCLLVDIIK